MQATLHILDPLRIQDPQPQPEATPGHVGPATDATASSGGGGVSLLPGRRTWRTVRTDPGSSTTGQGGVAALLRLCGRALRSSGGGGSGGGGIEVGDPSSLEALQTASEAVKLINEGMYPQVGTGAWSWH